MKLYISDLDGTLLNNEMALSEETIKILNELMLEGLSFSFATARSMDSVEKIIKPLNLNLPFIIFNGVAVYDPIGKKYLRKNTLKSPIVKAILKDVEKLNPFVFVLDENDDNQIYYKKFVNEGQFNFANSPLNKGEKRFKTVFSYDSLNFDEYLSIACIDKKDNLMEFFDKYKNNENLEIHLTEDVYQKEFYWLEFAKKGSTKKDALLFLKNHLNAKSLVTFGDNLNDISMFTVADQCYAVDNAHEDLKKIATSIIGKNTENSVVNKIRIDFKNLF